MFQSMRSMRQMMRPTRQRKAMFIGVFFIALGLSIILSIFFNIHIPIFRIAISLFLIYLGVRLLLGAFWHSPHPLQNHPWSHFWGGQTIFFSEANLTGQTVSHEPGRYTVIFGKGEIDLTQLSKSEAKNEIDDKKGTPIEINTVFGETTVWINPQVPLVITANAIFGEARMPDQNKVAFGTLNYRSEASKNTTVPLQIHGNVVFGSLQFKIKESDHPK